MDMFPDDLTDRLTGFSAWMGVLEASSLAGIRSFLLVVWLSADCLSGNGFLPGLTDDEDNSDVLDLDRITSLV